jgi:Fe-S-cluster-containing dehydrogenase component
MKTIFVFNGWNMKYTFKYFLCPSYMDNDTLPICVMGCVVSSLVYTNLGVFKSFVFINHYP